MEQITTKEQAVELIEGIVRNERFKVDAYFFCGFPTDQPNEKLIKVCENYLEKRDPETKSAMLSEMERMAAAGSVLDAGKNVLGSAADIQRVLEAKELLRASRRNTVKPKPAPRRGRPSPAGRCSSLFHEGRGRSAQEKETAGPFFSQPRKTFFSPLARRRAKNAGKEGGV